LIGLDAWIPPVTISAFKHAPKVGVGAGPDWPLKAVNQEGILKTCCDPREFISWGLRRLCKRGGIFEIQPVGSRQLAFRISAPLELG
jgi:hypothetical protein